MTRKHNDSHTDLRSVETTCRPGEMQGRFQNQSFPEHLTLLHEVSLRLSHCVDLDDLYRIAMEQGRDRLGYDRLSLWLEGSDPHRLHGTYGTDERGCTRTEKHLSMRSSTQSRSQYFSNGAVVDEDWPLLDDKGNRVGQGWHITAPVRDAESVIGVLNADNLVSQRLLLPHQAELLALYGAIIGHMHARLRAEAARRRSEAKFTTAFRVSPNSLGIADRETGRLIEINDGFVKLFGYPAEEALGRTAEDLNLWVDQKERDRLNAELEQNGCVQDMELRLRTKSGKILYCQTSIEPIQIDNQGENQSCILSITRDISSRKKSDQQVRRLNSELERRVQERTIELEEVNRELEAFSYSVSHDLRAPLRVMTGFTRILLNEYGDDLKPGAVHYLSCIQSNAEQMGHLINDLLAFSHLGRQPLKVQNVDMQALISQLIEEHRAETQERQILFKIGDLPACTGDPRLLRQVLTNLIGNAVKFTRPRNVAHIEIGFEGDAYFVRDNGVGFEPENSDKLFGVFQRLHHMEEFEGNGVGLAIVRRIILRHGGRVWAVGNHDQGATFYFTLPAISL